MRNSKTLAFIEASLSLLLLSSVVTPNIAHAQPSNGTQLWTDPENDVKIVFTYSPKNPSIDKPTVLKFSVWNLLTGQHLKNLVAMVVIITGSTGQERTFKFNNIYAPNGDFSIKYLFPDSGMYQVITRINSNNPQSIMLASFRVIVTPEISSLTYIITPVIIIAIIVGSISYFIRTKGKHHLNKRTETFVLIASISAILSVYFFLSLYAFPILMMKELANQQFGMNITYGDTDSIFVSKINEEHRHKLVDSFTATCRQNLGVEVDHQNTFVRSILVSKKHYIGIQTDGKVVIKGMEGKKRDRPPFFNQVFSQLIEDYRNNEPDLSLNILKAFKQLEAAEVDPSLLAYSVVLNKDPDEYRAYTPQHKIGTSMNEEAGSLIKYYKTGQEEDGYRGYSTNYQDLNIDVYKEELWRIVKEILTLQGYDIQKLEGQIFGGEVEDDIVYDTSLRLTQRQQTQRRRSQQNAQRNESLAKYLLSIQILNYVRS